MAAWESSAALFLNHRGHSGEDWGVDAPSVLYAGLSPGYVAFYQINVQVPANAPTATGVPVVLTITDSGGNSVSSHAGVTIAVQ